MHFNPTSTDANLASSLATKMTGACAWAALASTKESAPSGAPQISPDLEILLIKLFI